MGVRFGLLQRIAEPLDADAAGETTFYGGLDKVGREEGERDRHVDLRTLHLSRMLQQ
jgi:hypothetical protein